LEYIGRGSELCTTEDISRLVLTHRNDVRALFGVYACISHGIHREREPELNATEDISR